MQRELEIILTRQLASYLATPAFIVDPEGNLLFYNDPAEALLGHRFDETGEMLAREWSSNGSSPPRTPTARRCLRTSSRSSSRCAPATRRTGSSGSPGSTERGGIWR